MPKKAVALDVNPKVGSEQVKFFYKFFLVTGGEKNSINPIAVKIANIFGILQTSLVPSVRQNSPRKQKGKKSYWCSQA
jgi:hypothetical protein